MSAGASTEKNRVIAESDEVRWLLRTGGKQEQ